MSRRLPMLVLSSLLAVAWLVAWPFTIDDAYIVGRYAQRLAAGSGYTYNDGIVSDGVTGPLWLLPATLFAAVGLDPVTCGKGLGALASLASGLLIVARLQRGTLGQRASWLFVALLASSLPFVVWAVAGLESGLAALAVTLLALAASAHEPAGASAGVALGALVWLRPELLPLGLALMAQLLIRAPRAARTAAVIALLALLALALFRLALFSHLLPLSAHAKPALLANGAAYLARALISPRGLLAAAALAIAWRAAGRTRVLCVALAVHASSVLLAGGDWMAGRRLFAPVLPLFAWAVAEGLARVSLRSRMSLCFGATLVLVSGVELVPELMRVRAAGLVQRARIPELARHVCREPGAIAMIDIGALGVACPSHTFLDLAGLVEPHVAYARGAHLDKRISAAWLEGRAPRTIVLHSRERPRIDEERRIRWFAGYPVERRVLSFPFVQRAYRVQQVLEYADDYFYVVLVSQRRQARGGVKDRVRDRHSARPLPKSTFAGRPDLAP